MKVVIMKLSRKKPQILEDFDKGVIGWVYRFKEKGVATGLIFDLFIPRGEAPKEEFKLGFEFMESPHWKEKKEGSP